MPAVQLNVPGTGYELQLQNLRLEMDSNQAAIVTMPTDN